MLSRTRHRFSFAAALALLVGPTFASVSGPAGAAETRAARLENKYGPAAALAFARGYRGEALAPGQLYCYPDAKGVPFADTENIIPLTASLWTPAQLAADFNRRMADLPPPERKRGIVVLLKTERCAPKAMRACTVTTAALEKRATPLVGQFLVYGVLLKPRDNDVPAGSLKIETGGEAWKNNAAGEYAFKQGPGATLAFLNPADGAVLGITHALALKLTEADFTKNGGQAPLLHAKLQEVLDKISRR
ncbi:MAG TPA: hypothetical protein VHO24_21130 [Opitutaceae bacterium]|nr:hypothetical protein [Opitutaceae bacterium]